MVSLIASYVSHDMHIHILCVGTYMRMPHLLAAVGRSCDQIILLCGQEPNLTAFLMRYMTLSGMTLTELFCRVSNRNGFLVLDSL